MKSTDASSAHKNNSLFTSYIRTNNITSLRAQVNSMYYPVDRMELNFLYANYLEPYLSMINCCKIFGNEPQLTAQEFKDIYTIFCVDVNCQPKQLNDNGISITLHIG